MSNTLCVIGVRKNSPKVHPRTESHFYVAYKHATYIVIKVISSLFCIELNAEMIENHKVKLNYFIFTSGHRDASHPTASQFLAIFHFELSDQQTWPIHYQNDMFTEIVLVALKSVQKWLTDPKLNIEGFYIYRRYLELQMYGGKSKIEVLIFTFAILC